MNWYFGWNIVAAAATITLLTVGLRMGIGPFFLPIVEDLGFSRSLLGTIVAAGMLCYGLAMPLAGFLVARLGTRPVLMLGNAALLGGAFWTVNATDPLSFLFGFGILLSLGLALCSPITVTPVLAKWFVRRRGMAFFFLSTGSMAGIAILTPLLAAAIEAVGWQHTMVGFAILYTLIAVPLTLFVVRDQAPPHADLGAQPASAAASNPRPAAESLPLAHAMRTQPFWKITLGLFACGYSMNLLGTHGVPMLMDHGFDATTSSLGIGTIGLVAIFSTILLGRIADTLPRKQLLATIYFVRGLGFFALLIVGTHWELYVAAAIGGIVWAGSIAMSSAILADIYGVRLVGVLYGFAYLGHQIGGTISSWLGGWGYERFGTHWLAFGSAGALLLVAAVIAIRLPPKDFTLMAPMRA
ncbi:MFS transporter [Parapusillimonas sp. SGNA-6]|jgi:MFS family permease|nr:MFS transporter [Parapusillimonas sp. SGNA-6]